MPSGVRLALVLLLLLWTSSTHGADIHDAATAGDVTRVAALVRADPTVVHAADSQGLTALHHAAARDHAAVVRILLANGANVNARNLVQSTPLHITAHRGQVQAARELLNNHAEIEPRDDKG